MAREAVVVLSYCCAVSQRSQLSGAYRVESAPHQVTDPRSRHRAADTGLWPFSAGRFPNGAWRAVTFSSALRCPLPRCRTSHIWSVSEAAAAPPDARHVRPAPHARHQPSARRVSKGTFRYRVTRGARCEVRGASRYGSCVGAGLIADAVACSVGKPAPEFDRYPTSR